jgi:hypothetical protein
MGREIHDYGEKLAHKYTAYPIVKVVAIHDNTIMARPVMK